MFWAAATKPIVDVCPEFRPVSSVGKMFALKMSVDEPLSVVMSKLSAAANGSSFRQERYRLPSVAYSSGLSNMNRCTESKIPTQDPSLRSEKNFGENHGRSIQNSLAILFDKELTDKDKIKEIKAANIAEYRADGLHFTGTKKLAKLDIFYALARRKVRYITRFSADAVAEFSSSQRDFIALIDVAARKISIETNPLTQVTVDFLRGDRDYIIEIYHEYQLARLVVTDCLTGLSASLEVVNDGQGGVGKGALQTGFAVGMQWDHYCFGLKSGTDMLIKRISVFALQKKVKLLIYGDSISQPEGYFPSEDFHLAWTSQLIAYLDGNALSSGRGGANIDMVNEYIKNELPFIKADYVMVTIGTNGGNTEEKLSWLVEYIRSQGSIPILNNIPANESGTQIAQRELIEKVRKKYSINGAALDVPTSLANDGKEVDKSTMYWEDYTGTYGWQIYHHPNEVGGIRMFKQILKDVPELGNGKL